MTYMLDLEEAKAVIAEQRKISDPHIKDDGIKGIVARSISVHEAMTFWRIGEVNRRSDPNDVMTAIFNIFANAIAAELEMNVDQAKINEAMALLTIEFQARVQRCLQLISKSPAIEAKEVGTA